MKALRFGDSGSDVRTLQLALTRRGAGSLEPDRVFGKATEQGVRKFQQDNALAVDGVVGPLTAHALALGACSDDEWEWAIRLASAMFPKSAYANLVMNAPRVYNALHKSGLGDEQMTLYAFATVYAETGDFTPKSEGISRYNTEPGGKPFGKYDRRADLGNHNPGDGARSKGRGFIQITGLDNYRRFGEVIGVNLLEEPDKANLPLIAAAILAAFLKQREGRIRSALNKGRVDTARRAVNGGVIGLKDFSTAYARGKEWLKTHPKP